MDGRWPRLRCDVSLGNDVEGRGGRPGSAAPLPLPDSCTAGDPIVPFSSERDCRDGIGGSPMFDMRRREFPQAGGLMSYGSSLADAIPESFLARADELIE
jgi:hypothetical protein